MNFDWNFSVGNLLTAAALMIGFLAAHTQNVRRLAKIEERLNLIYRWWETHWIGGRPPKDEE